VIKEEYDFNDISSYLFSKIDLIITGEPNEESRSSFIIDKWKGRGKPHLSLNLKGVNQVNYRYTDPERNMSEFSDVIDIMNGLPDIMKGISISKKNVLVDLSSLDHVLSMVLIKQLIKQYSPKCLFAAYARPEKYHTTLGSDGLLLSDSINGVKAVPGYVKREIENQTLCAFVGFEGIRLKAVLESLNNINKIVPIVAFPSGGLHWFKTTMWQSMDVFETETRDLTIRKCFSESVFDAISILEEVQKQEDKIVVAPLGTRPHSVATAIFATKYPNTRIIYDYVVERQNRTEGISHVCVYHLSSFLET